MRKVIRAIVPALMIFSILLQSCAKSRFHDDKGPLEDGLLLSKVSGSIQSDDPNFYFAYLNNYYTYKWSGKDPVSSLPNHGDFEFDYNYASVQGDGPWYKRISQELFPLRKGSYDFLYNGYFPDKVVDSSIGGSDLGYWKIFYNGLRQVDKTGLSFSSTADPSRFEYYSRGYSGQLKGFVYGRAIDTPYMKVAYQYDPKGNVSRFDIYLLDVAPGITARSADKRKHPDPNGINNGKMRDDATYDQAARVDTFNYKLYMTANITTDDKKNPFSQEGSILFYQTNRWVYFYDPLPFFLPLLKSNPVRIEYSVPSWGDLLSVQTFSYNYNTKGYPVSIHEEFSDPDFAVIGNYTRDSQVEYISN